MELIFIVVLIILALILFFVRGMIDERKKEKQIRREIHESFGRKEMISPGEEEWKSIPAFFRTHRGDEAARFILDDITWNDLNMDSVFARVNHTWSSAGQEYLYYALRTPVLKQEELKGQNERIQWFFTHEKEREELQYLYRKLGKSGKYSIYDYLTNLDACPKRSSLKSIAADILLVLSVILLPYDISVAIPALFILISVQMFSYMKQKRETEPYLVSFAYVKRMLDFCGQIRKIPVPPLEQEWQELESLGRKFGKFRFGALLGMRGSTMAGDPFSVLMDYVNMIFHLDLLAFRFMLREVKQHLDGIDRMIELAGRTETEIAAASFRASLTDGWCCPEFSAKPEFSCQEMYHPLLTNPVKNDIVTGRGVLVTGSNASGKSTFLRAAAVNAVLAQTIQTCAAGSYRAPLFRICTSMALRDDLEGGESYYMAEIRALKRIMDLAEVHVPLFCLVDEVLRGTNTVERIAASTQILKKLSRPGVICFAATHDIELTELLKDRYDNHHFEEKITETDGERGIFFDYKLRPGKATTRNAIRLLGMLGYGESIIEAANEMAAGYLETGSWN